ncbi:chemotaxis protein CheB [Hufsiella ginkgonis]|uniref:histidine kinase n=1 Tax=Hufsiella ginkgonis TaxID=2695274 RepID=A0A7K1Y088_9SPHI|nr:chemotaxis protein CheB [Hufsiella ginkgonis]MXV16633.1 chemotaxis protein CheR [Hufsiella ginkgonis]
MPSVEPHHIIAIGSSAGGLDEINAFFDHTPVDNVSYVIIQHFSPDFKSKMVGLLSRHSKLIVEEASDGADIKSNQVYLIPNDQFMTIRDGRLYLSSKTNVRGPHLTINTFFTSLAEDCGSKAIGIVLSGLGTDGSEGVKAIKKAGGMVIARTPDTTEFGSMPSSAIATGMVDFVLEPELMPDAIGDFVKYEVKIVADTPEDEAIMSAIIDLIKERSPLDFSDYKLTTLLRRTRKRAAYCNHTTLGNYLDFLRSSPEEATVLAKDFLIGVTSFFRDPDVFDFVQSDVLPRLLQSLSPGEELKLWVAGCATGEEAYSLAIAICELLTGDLKDTVVKIFATDIDSVALVSAGRGVYNSGITKYVSSGRLDRHFIKEGDKYRVKPAIRKMVIFARHDMVKNPPYCNMHFISCRNLLIYMTPVLQKKLFTMMLFGLRKNGYLLLGSSETPAPIIGSLEVIHKRFKVYRNLEVKRVLSLDNFSLPDLPGAIHAAPVFSKGSTNQQANHVLAEAMTQGLVTEMDCLVMCVDERNHVLKSYGDTTRYLLQKNFTHNLPDLLPAPLAVAFNALTSNVLRTGKREAVKGIRLRRGEADLELTLTASPLALPQPDRRCLMVTISEDTAAPFMGNAVLFDDQLYHGQYTINLEEAVRELKEQLISAHEQLDASNENLQSFNEELISANEEMQSTNEEMQSVNEELQTINADYQLKNRELTEINDDLNNYFRSNVNGQLFISDDLLLMKFSPGTVGQINLVESDIGRPLHHISTNIKFDTIIEDIKQVLSEGSVLAKEVETHDGKWYQVMTMPYVRQADNHNTGAIITFSDITELKKTQIALDGRNKSLQRINADLDHFIHAASHDLLAPLGNIETSINIMNKMSLSDTKLVDFHGIINTSIKTFRSLITDIASIARVEGNMLAMEMVNVEDLVNNVRWSLEDKIELSGATITLELEATHIFFSKKNLRSILFNLVSNAIKFRGDALPMIVIRTVEEGGFKVLSVKDNGIGMSPYSLTKIFDMYGRLNQDAEGQGIGLYLAKKIINAANGEILVESEPGKGSLFTIRFSERAAS